MPRLDEDVLVAQVSIRPSCKVCTHIVKGWFAYIVKVTKYRFGFFQEYL